MFSLTNYLNPDAAVINLLRSLSINIDGETITAELDKHPDYPNVIALNDSKNKTIVRKALHEWHEQKQKNYDARAKAFPIQLNGAEYHKIDTQKAWCEIAEITATPTLLLNGYRLPDLYHVTNLKYMLE